MSACLSDGFHARRSIAKARGGNPLLAGDVPVHRPDVPTDRYRGRGIRQEGLTQLAIGKAAFVEFDCDYNNYCTELRSQEPGAQFDSVPPREKILFCWSKAIIRLFPSNIPKHRFISMDHWRAYSGKDAHSIFADPLHRACGEQRFELDPKSPNLSAGERGSTIGCFDSAR